jgi:NAD(P)H-hydrate epimerase
LQVCLLQLGDAARLKGDALASAEAYRAAGGAVRGHQEMPQRTDVIVDGVFGTGLEREVSGRWRETLEAVNRHPAPVLALDIPSGLHADSGQVLGVAVRARATISFIGLKQGMFTGQGPEHCGDIRFDALQVPAVIYSREILSARRLDWAQQSSALSPRRRTAHKGDFGHLLVVGGERGFAGAARLAGESAARTGAGLVTVATHPAHAVLSTGSRPELMCQGIESPQQLDPLLRRATVVAIGPGLGQGRWGLSLLGRVLQTSLPMVVDADALNLLAEEPLERHNWVLTPHPGEAARLLGTTAGQVQADRYLSVLRLQQRYGGVAVLKGSGTLIQGPGQRPCAVCSQGNPGMATGGMGDVLTGVIGGLMAQGFEAEEAACMGVCLHSAAADRAAEDGERGMLAGDLMPEIRRLANPGATGC